MKQYRPFAAVFAVIMLLFVLFQLWYIPSVTERSFQLQDLQKSLETSQGRERKQQYEYDKVVAEIPQVRSELDLITPQKEAAEKEVADLKAERKKLRAEKKELEEMLSGNTSKEASSDEK